VTTDMKEQREILERINWDYLIILDACRADYFEWCNNIEGEYHRVLSNSSCTQEWLKNNEKYARESIVFAGNPQISLYWKEIAKCLVEVWDFGWSEEHSTVLPNTVTDIAISTAKPKSIIWYMQPHFPAIGRIKLTPYLSKEKSKYYFADTLVEKMLKNREITLDQYKIAYWENLRKVLGEVQRLLDHLSGTIIITADHGEFLGEKDRFLHPCGLKDKELIEVPLLLIEKRNNV